MAASYELTQLSPWRQRLTNVVIGDPASPDLTADWVEVRTALAPWRAQVLAVRAGQVRLRGRVVGGRVSVGALDRLMPPPSGKPFAPPALIVDVADAQVSLDTPAGAVRLAIAGKGMLNDGFKGVVHVSAPRLALAGCDLMRADGRLAVQIRKAQPSLQGPVAVAGVQCGQTGVRGAKVTVKARVSGALDQWRGNAAMQARAVTQPGLRFAAVDGEVSFQGVASATRGQIELRSGGFDVRGNRGKTAAISGAYGAGGSGLSFTGQAQVDSMALAPSLRNQVQRLGSQVNAGPLQPIMVALSGASAAAARRFDASGDLSLAYRAGAGALTMSGARVRGASGAQADFDGTARIGLAGSSTRLRAAGTLAVRGGGLPQATLRFVQERDQIRGTGAIAPYAAGGARLSVADLAFRLRGGSGTAIALAHVSGNTAQGQIEQLRLPLSATWAPGSLSVNTRCIDAAFRHLAVGGLVLGPHSMAVCPEGGAMVRLMQGRIGGGMRLQQPRLAGMLGENPLRFTAEQVRFDLGRQRLAIAGAALRLGADGGTRMDVAALSGALAGTPGGTFSGLAGQIGAVPLLVSAGAGDWRLGAGALTLAGALQIRDAADRARFHPLATNNAQVRVSADEVRASATLNTLRGGAKVAEVRIGHALNSGLGSAEIEVDGLRFAEQGLQPHDLTPLTYGVIAEVNGAVSGKGRIAWSRHGVTSSGTFGTDDIDLAAAFGPVRGLATTLHFTDLLNMRTAAEQVAKVAEVNPGVPVNDGMLRFQILGSQRVQVEGGRWPFAGGELVLEPTLLDFSQSRERRLTFQVVGADAALFLKEMEFDNISAIGRFDGTLPMVFDAQGGRIEGGVLEARAGGTIAYAGEVSRHDLGFWGNMAFQALRSLNYRSLSIGMNGPLAGDMVTDIRFAGVSQGKGTKSNFVIRRLARLPFVFNIRISAPFQQLLSSVQSWYDPSRLIERNLPALLEEQGRTAEAAAPPAIQPADSQTMRLKEQK
ncbi:YdbH domain-containing protein [Sphingomonas sp. IC-56]|nr:YdbH domain-containing protein [Sphingomonas sp. IC-56]